MDAGIGRIVCDVVVSRIEGKRSSRRILQVDPCSGGRPKGEVAMDESTSGTEPTKGTVSDQRIGSYRILEPLGTGGMSSVFRAVHDETGHEVALKVLTRTLARNSTLLQRFMREARSAETLEHPNIVTIYDRGIDRGVTTWSWSMWRAATFTSTSSGTARSAWPRRSRSSRASPPG